MAKPDKRDFRQEVTDSIVAMLEQGTAPWQRPWDPASASRAMDLPYNGATGRPYSGGNAMHLMAKGISKGYDDPRWMTYEQAQSKGWQVRRGERSTAVEFWQFDKKEVGADGKERRVKLDRPIQRLYAVFNAKQIDGVPPLPPKAREGWEGIQAAERALQNSGAKIAHEGTHAYYSPAEDKITLPPRSAFPDQGSYYGTALHELGHWTGHASRMNREGITAGHSFGSAGYAREELRAEMASVFLQGELGVPHDTQRHAAYVKNWIEVLSKDKNEIFRAAKDAGQIADYVKDLSKHKELSDEVADQLAEKAATNTAARYQPLASTHLDKQEATRLLQAAEHRELAALAERELSTPEDRAKLMQRSPFANRPDTEARQELDSALRELEYIENLPTHIAIASNEAKDKRIVTLRDLDAVAYVDKQAGDLTIAAKSPGELKNMLARATVPGEQEGGPAVVGNKAIFKGQEGQRQASDMLAHLGVPARDAQRVTELAAPRQAGPDELSASFDDAGRQAKQLLGSRAKTHPPQTGEGVYTGPVVAQTAHHVVQQVSATITVAHPRQAFPTPPDVDPGRPLRVTYQDGQAQLSTPPPKRQRERANSLAR